MQIVWFKRDLRVQDNSALTRAAECGEVLPLYVVEPDLWQQPDMSARHWGFIAETLEQLRADLGKLGQPLVIRTGEITKVLSDLHATEHLSALWSHEETGNNWTYRRDLKVAEWCTEHGVRWREVKNHGVQRRMTSREGWARRWDAHMAQPKALPPVLSALEMDLGRVPSSKDLQLVSDSCPDRQPGGRSVGLKLLDSFLHSRGETYQRAMSSPLQGAYACSRLSPYLAWGAVSMREVAQATGQRQQNLSSGAQAWRKSLRSFSGRLHWHCHFIQKLEDEPRIEFKNLHKLYDDLRPEQPDPANLYAWANGQTGYPFLDACMRSLRATGWLNFRMRAMVMATASYHLWLDWRAPGLELARLFTDYEPGIHWNQVQMQSGTTGINAVRIYNPVKQGKDQDPSGAFTRQWVPELAAIADPYLQEPWSAPNTAAVVGTLYPERIFDHLAAAKLARERIWAVRRTPAFHIEAAAIQSKHGSRKRRSSSKARSKPSAQLSLPLDG
ncbi:deoxyribodipyrimidine photolyase [Ruegeria sp. HKCCD4884]|uniref:FAD-binding domain-containing protein n=1 Tax=Ruegeria sp. HKCCD4884 TaxID=2683022 RepID=UPI001492804A|nr:FAD-binding domain-containing protein [Ruegeria sp. HKCCD4884]NOD95324.1 deoxyribodipyrimidine photolyase [Ruegeria sp. HKCCD4884]